MATSGNMSPSWWRLHWNFQTLHYLYFIITCLLSAVVLWGSATPSRSLSFTDALFLAVSAMTEAGLNTVNLSTLNTFQQVWLFLLIIIGSSIFVSAFVVQIRRSAFERKFRDIRQQERDRPLEAGRLDNDDAPIQEHNERRNTSEDVTAFESKELGQAPVSNSSSSVMTKGESGVQRQRGGPRMQGENTQNSGDIFGGWIGRNSQFYGLSEKEREKLGGHEYRAVSLLAWLVPAYFVAWQLLGAIACGAWVAYQRPDPAIQNGLSPFWLGSFNAISAFNNSGMSLLDQNMIAFQTAYYLLLTMGLLILAGNTCYPIFLRVIIWTMWQVVKRFEDESSQKRARTLRFLLDHPRRCYTNLFPSQHTWWLLLAVITLNGIDWAGFEILNIGNDALSGLSDDIRVIDGLFQALAVRSGGFYVVSIPTVRISLQVLYVLMMYISVYPVVITMRNSNIYEERSLGIYVDNRDDDGAVADPQSDTNQNVKGFLSRVRHIIDGTPVRGRTHRQPNTHFVRQQLRAQLAHDAWWIVLALFLIMIVESGQFAADPTTFSVFNFIFEIVSAYGCVGISVGVPWDSYSFCGSWHVLSKLILCAVMLRGRHRGLPIAIDKAVLLPGEDLEQAEEDDGRIRRARATSSERWDV